MSDWCRRLWDSPVAPLWWGMGVGAVIIAVVVLVHG